MRKLLVLLFALALLASLAFNIYAVDLEQEGSITLELQFDDAPVIGGQFSCTKVADVVDEDGNLYFKTLKEEKIYREGIPAVSTMEQLVKENEVFFHPQTLTLNNESGTVVFQKLLPGLYLITQDTQTQDYCKINPFLVSVPYMDEGVYIYDVSAKAKTALEKEVTEPTKPEDKDEKLPQTGQLNWPIPVLAASGLIIFVLGWYLRFGRKKDRYEK